MAEVTIPAPVFRGRYSLNGRPKNVPVVGTETEDVDTTLQPVQEWMPGLWLFARGSAVFLSDSEDFPDDKAVLPVKVVHDLRRDEHAAFQDWFRLSLGTVSFQPGRRQPVLCRIGQAGFGDWSDVLNYYFGVE